MRGTLHILDQTGDTTLVWDSEVTEVTENGPLPQQEVDRRFDALVKDGFFLFGTDANKKSVQLKKFDPDYEVITASPRFVGG